MHEQTLFQLLGISYMSTEETVKRAYIQFAKQHHPDLHPDDKGKEERFKTVTAEYQNWRVVKDAVYEIRRIKNLSDRAKIKDFERWIPLTIKA
ncbi:MAG: DnaJ domain-containing protein [Deltaproteobacteria bacterium]|nr:DnaJ domain-containing protein [Deltaproteobacteria bacterium]